MEHKKWIQRRMVISCLAGLVAFLALMTVTYAWYVSRKESLWRDMHMSSTDLPFEIATHGTKGIRYEQELLSVEEEFEEGISKNINDKNFYLSSGENRKIILRYDTGDSVVAPGSQGMLDLYVIPKEDGFLSAQISMEVKAYASVEFYDLDASGKKIQKKDGAGNLVFESNGTTPVWKTTSKLVNVMDLQEDLCTLEQNEIARLQKAGEYLKGHILFFAGTGGTDYSFSKPLTDHARIYSDENAVKNTLYAVPIYWIWPNTIGQVLLDGGDEFRKGIPVVQDGNAEEKAALRQYLKDNKNLVFKDASVITTAMLDHASQEENFAILSEEYDGADYEIGVNISYFVIELTVENVE